MGLQFWFIYFSYYILSFMFSFLIWQMTDQNCGFLYSQSGLIFKYYHILFHSSVCAVLRQSP